MVRRAELAPAMAAAVFVCRPPLEAPTGRFLGVVHVQRLLREPPHSQLGNAVDRALEPLPTDAKLLSISRHLATYNLVSAPVVDAVGPAGRRRHRRRRARPPAARRLARAGGPGRGRPQLRPPPGRRAGLDHRRGSRRGPAPRGPERVDGGRHHEHRPRRQRTGAPRWLSPTATDATGRTVRSARTAGAARAWTRPSPGPAGGSGCARTSTRRASASVAERFARFMGTAAVPGLHDARSSPSGCCGTPSPPPTRSSTRARSTTPCSRSSCRCRRPTPPR